MRKTSPLLWQRPNWPNLTANAPAVFSALLAARKRQGEVIGRAGAIGLNQAAEITGAAFVREAMSTAAIEGEALNPASVQSSVLRKLGIESPLSAPFSRDVDGLIEVMHDASFGFERPLDEDRLCRWQSALFPGGTSGIKRIAVGRYRDHLDPMQIVSGYPGREIVHYTAPRSADVKREMDAFLAWFARTAPAAPQAPPIDGIARAAIAHLWFETIHPFEDGNGRLGRAIIDLAMAEDARSPTRLYSLSAEIMKNRRGYYDALSAAQHGDTDVSAWVQWFAEALACACVSAAALMDSAIERSRFWANHADLALNIRQRKVVQRLLDDGDGGFIGPLNAEKYIKLTGASKPTASRDLADLVQLGLLSTRGQGKALRYFVRVPGWTHAAPTTQESSAAPPEPAIFLPTKTARPPPHSW